MGLARQLRRLFSISKRTVKPGVFWRYTKSARRVVFFARYEAGMRASPAITPLYLLMGALREGGSLVDFALGLPGNCDAICERILLPERVAKDKADILTDIPLDQDSKKALAWAVAEADGDGSTKIEPFHLVRSLLCFPNEAQAVLNAVGIELAALRAAKRPGGFIMFRRRMVWWLRMLFREAVLPALVVLGVGFCAMAALMLAFDLIRTLSSR